MSKKSCFTVLKYNLFLMILSKFKEEYNGGNTHVYLDTSVNSTYMIYK